MSWKLRIVCGGAAYVIIWKHEPIAVTYMVSKEFYRIDSKLSPTAVQAHAVGLDKASFIDGLAAEWHLISGDYAGVNFPIVFKQEYGTKLQDILDTGWPSLFLISDRIKVILDENALTGWMVFAVEVQDKQGRLIPGYHGFSITGRCGKIDYGKAEIIEKRLVQHGPLVRYYKSLPIGLEKWDGADFFLPEKYFGIVITRNAAVALKKSKLTNIRFENLSDIETDYSAVHVVQQNNE